MRGSYGAGCHDLGARYQQSASYVPHPELRTYLGHLAPAMTADYRWWESEIDYSRLSMAGHVLSDLGGGVLLGDMVAEYFTRSRS